MSNIGYKSFIIACTISIGIIFPANNALKNTAISLELLIIFPAPSGTENYKTIALFDVKSKVIMAISINQNIPAEAVANKLMKIITE